METNWNQYLIDLNYVYVTKLYLIMYNKKFKNSY